MWRGCLLLAVALAGCGGGEPPLTAEEQLAWKKHTRGWHERYAVMALHREKGWRDIDAA